MVISRHCIDFVSCCCLWMLLSFKWWVCKSCRCFWEIFWSINTSSSSNIRFQTADPGLIVWWGAPAQVAGRRRRSIHFRPAPMRPPHLRPKCGPTKKCRRPPRTAEDRLTAEAWFGPENVCFCVYFWSDFFFSKYFVINPHCHHDLITYLNHKRLLLAMTAQYPHYRHPRRRTADAYRIG